MSDLSAFGWALRKVLNEAIPTVPQEGQREKWKALKPHVKTANVQRWAQCSQGSTWESGGEVGDGSEKRVMECESCREHDKQGRGWERQWQ
jgi:trehalose-6-phosphate synthase